MTLMRKHLLLTSSLVVPDPEQGDRPFEDRPYGRIRMNEAMARELQRILREEMSRLLEQRHDLPEGQARFSLTQSLKSTRKLLDNTHGMMVEKGWDE